MYYIFKDKNNFDFIIILDGLNNQDDIRLNT